MLLGMVTALNAVQLQNARSPMDVTGSPAMTLGITKLVPVPLKPVISTAVPLLMTEYWQLPLTAAEAVPANKPTLTVAIGEKSTRVASKTVIFLRFMKYQRFWEDALGRFTRVFL